MFSMAECVKLERDSVQPDAARPNEEGKIVAFFYITWKAITLNLSSPLPECPGF